jgi:alpha-ketoglutarate-dependent taurine dioxygenase
MIMYKVENCSYEKIISNIQSYIEIFLENGLIIFPELKITEIEQKNIMDIFGKELNWGYINKVDTEDHLVSFNLNNQLKNSNEIFIKWHLEHVARPNPQVGASWNMITFFCEEGAGSTGFIDSCKIYDILPDKWKSFIDNGFVTSCFEGAKERKCVISHRNTGVKVLRLSSVEDDEILTKVYEKKALKKDNDLFQEIKKWFINQVVNKDDYKIWWNWKEGDLIIVDLSRMIHCVKGGFLVGERIFTRYWAYENEEDYRMYTYPEYDERII